MKNIQKFIKQKRQTKLLINKTTTEGWMKNHLEKKKV